MGIREAFLKVNYLKIRQKISSLPQFSPTYHGIFIIFALRCDFIKFSEVINGLVSSGQEPEA